MELTIAQIKEMLQNANAQELAIMERSLGADTRKGVQTALAQARRRCEAAEKEAARLARLYEYERNLAPNETSIIVGLDEVGRGPIAGPLAVGAVVLGKTPIEGLNDSKQVKEKDREMIAETIKQTARAFYVALVDATVIDEVGMSQALRQAFSEALHEVDKLVPGIDVVLIDGNPLHIDSREINIIKGDAQCASIAAASILAKVTRDNLMVAYDQQYPGYGFTSHKGYGSHEHIQALKQLGPSPLHRLSFCSSFLQPTLFDL